MCRSSPKMPWRSSALCNQLPGTDTARRHAGLWPELWTPLVPLLLTRPFSRFRTESRGATEWRWPWRRWSSIWRTLRRGSGTGTKLPFLILLWTPVDSWGIHWYTLRIRRLRNKTNTCMPFLCFILGSNNSFAPWTYLRARKRQPDTHWSPYLQIAAIQRLELARFNVRASWCQMFVLKLKSCVK